MIDRTSHSVEHALQAIQSLYITGIMDNQECSHELHAIRNAIMNSSYPFPFSILEKAFSKFLEYDEFPKLACKNITRATSQTSISEAINAIKLLAEYGVWNDGVISREYGDISFKLRFQNGFDENTIHKAFEKESLAISAIYLSKHQERVQEAVQAIESLKSTGVIVFPGIFKYSSGDISFKLCDLDKAFTPKEIIDAFTVVNARSTPCRKLLETEKNYYPCWQIILNLIETGVWINKCLKRDIGSIVRMLHENFTYTKDELENASSYLNNRTINLNIGLSEESSTQKIIKLCEMIKLQVKGHLSNHSYEIGSSEIILSIDDSCGLNVSLLMTHSDAYIGLKDAVIKSIIEAQGKIVVLLPYKASINLDKFCGQKAYPLELAVNGSSTIITKRLLRAGVSPYDYSGNISPLAIACFNGNVEIVREFLIIEANAELISDSDNIPLPLLLAIEGGHVDILKLLFELGPFVSTPDAEMPFYEELLWLALDYKQNNCLKILLNYLDNYSKDILIVERLLFKCAVLGELDLFKYFINLCRNVNFKLNSPEFEYSLLTTVAKSLNNNASDILEQILEKGADINAIYHDYDRTDLMLAAITGDTFAVKVLMQLGADPSLRDSLGYNALDLAIKNNNQEVSKILAKYMY